MRAGRGSQKKRDREFAKMQWREQKEARKRARQQDREFPKFAIVNLGNGITYRTGEN